MKLQDASGGGIAHPQSGTLCYSRSNLESILECTIVAKQKARWTGLLKKPIHLADVPVDGLRTSLALPPDSREIRTYVANEFEARIKALDEFFGLDRGSADIWEQRAKALVEREFGIRACDLHWWKHFADHLMRKHVPGFSVKRIDEKKRGAGLQWSDTLLMQLFADVEFLRKQTGKSITEICKIMPRMKGYITRWGHYRSNPEALRKAYTIAKRHRRDIRFEMLLCGPEAVIRGKPGDRIKAAIRLHALERQ
jgi:hypothetical protein